MKNRPAHIQTVVPVGTPSVPPTVTTSRGMADMQTICMVMDTTLPSMTITRAVAVQVAARRRWWLRVVGVTTAAVRMSDFKHVVVVTAGVAVVAVSALHMLMASGAGAGTF